jgi:hypothetical protein
MRSMVEGGFRIGCATWSRPTTTGCAGGPPPRAGEDLEDHTIHSVTPTASAALSSATAT